MTQLSLVFIKHKDQKILMITSYWLEKFPDRINHKKYNLHNSPGRAAQWAGGQSTPRSPRVQMLTSVGNIPPDTPRSDAEFEKPVAQAR